MVVKKHSKYYTCISCWKQIKHAGGSANNDECGTCKRKKSGVRRREFIPNSQL